MSEYDFSIENQRFHLIKPDTLVIYGWYRGDNPGNRTVELYLDGKRLDYTLDKKKGVEIRQKYMRYHADINEELTFLVPLPKNWQQSARLKVIGVYGTKQTTIRSYSIRNLQKLQQSVDYYLESEHIEEGQLTISGWAMGAEPVCFTVWNQAGEQLEQTLDLPPSCPSF